MKTTSRIHKKRNASTPKPQAKTPAKLKIEPRVIVADGGHTSPEAAQEMKQAIMQANTLFELIDTHIEYRGEAFTGDRAKQFKTGLSILIGLSTFRLTDASSGVWYAAFPKKREVSA